METKDVVPAEQHERVCRKSVGKKIHCIEGSIVQSELRWSRTGEMTDTVLFLARGALASWARACRGHRPGIQAIGRQWGGQCVNRGRGSAW